MADVQGLAGAPGKRLRKSTLVVTNMLANLRESTAQPQSAESVDALESRLRALMAEADYRTEDSVSGKQLMRQSNQVLNGVLGKLRQSASVGMELDMLEAQMQA